MGEASSSSTHSPSVRWRSPASAAAPNTRRAYATAYRAFAGFLHARHGEASVQTFTVAAVAGWRDELTAQGLSASTVAQRVSAVRRLAAAIGADPLVAQVRCTQVQHGAPQRALGSRARRRCSPDRICAQRSASRDRAILELLARAGLRRSELARLTLCRRPGARPPTRRAPAHRDSSTARRPDPARGRRARL